MRISEITVPAPVVSLVAAALAASAAHAQVGGRYEALQRLDGYHQYDAFGYAVAGAGDINKDGFDDFLVGAPQVRAHAVGGGAVYIYSGADNSLLYQINGAANNYLGGVIAGAGDINQDGFHDFMIGNPNASVGGMANAGVATVYSGMDGSVLLQFSGTVANAKLGRAIANAGDVDADGVDDIMLSASDPANWIATVEVLSGATGAQLYFYQEPQFAYGFGLTMSTIGDIDQDDHADFIIGAPYADVGSYLEAGSAFVYSGATGQQLYRWDGRFDEAYFASDVAHAGDVNGDGDGDIIIGSGYPVGTVTVRSGSNNSLLYTYTGTYKNRFGESVSGAGDINLDGYDDFIIGDPANMGYSNKSRAILYSGVDGSILYTAKAGEGDELGYSVAAAGDVNGDGYPDCLVGAPSYPANSNQGPGGVIVLGFNPHLNLSTETVSAATGATISMQFQFPPRAANYEYKTLISASGIGPTHYGVDIPLTQDALALDTFNGIYPVANHSDLHGTLDANASSTGSMTIPGGLPSAMIGNTYWFAAIAFKAGGFPEHSSVARAVLITP